MAPLHIASLGSSFAAGPGIEPVADRHAARSAANYAALLAARLGPGTRLTDLTVSGATLGNVFDTPQRALLTGSPLRVFNPQIDDLPEDSGEDHDGNRCDIILLLGGGNDLGYIGGFFKDAARSSSWFARMISNPSGEGDADDIEDDDDNSSTDGERDDGDNDDNLADSSPRARALVSLYVSVLEAIHVKQPRALVLVTEYMTMLGPDARPEIDVPFDAERVAHHRHVYAKLLAATRRAVAVVQEKQRHQQQGESAPWCELVSVAEPSASHGLGSSEPWVSGISWQLLWQQCAFHPNAAGMRGVADILYRRLVELGKVEGGKMEDGEGSAVEEDGGEATATG